MTDTTIVASAEVPKTPSAETGRSGRPDYDTQAWQPERRRQRDEDIVAAYQSGATLKQLGDKYGLTPSRIYQIVRHHDARLTPCEKQHRASTLWARRGRKPLGLSHKDRCTYNEIGRVVGWQEARRVMGVA